MLLVVHIKNGGKYIFEISQMMYDKENNVIWFENGGKDVHYWINSYPYFDNSGVWIDETTLKNYKLSLVDRLGINMNRYTELENIYNLIEKSLLQFGQAHIVLDPYK